MSDRVRELLAFDLALAHRFGQRGSEPIRFAGFDEAGRGALAGPVCVACVHVPLGAHDGPDRDRLLSILAGLDDSKRLSVRRRETLHEAIVSRFAWGFGCSSAREIDRAGIVAACAAAARRAVSMLAVGPDVGLFDRGLSLPDGATPNWPALELTRGDARSLHIAAASIVAKVGRDAIMQRLGDRFAGYGLARHKGYGTALHRERIGRLGPSTVHRRSFCSRIERAESQSC